MPLPSTLSDPASRALAARISPPDALARRLRVLPALVDLTEADLRYLAAVGSVRQAASGEDLSLTRGEEAAATLVLAGALRLPSASLSGPGRTVPAGTWSGVAGLLGAADPAPVTPSTGYALDDTEVLNVPLSSLQARCATAPAFAARVYRMCARALAAATEQEDPAANDVAELDAALESLRSLLHDADRAAISSGGVVPDDFVARIRTGFRDLVRRLHATLGEASGRPPSEREALGARVQRAFLPYLLLTTTSERLYAKPRGYAGDSVSIDGIYANQPSGTGRLGPLLDRCFLDEPAAQAVRNRRGLLREEIQATLDRNPGRTVHVTTMACGPAREVFDVFESLEDAGRLQVELIDFDGQALDQVGGEAAERGLSQQLTLHNANLVELAIGKRKLDLPPQDLVYSIGLIDYFVDKLVTRLMSYGHGLLAPGGEMILGNFHPRNEDKALMDHVLDWRLIHRDEGDMDRLYRASAFDRACTRLRFEQAGVNLFAVCRRDS